MRTYLSEPVSIHSAPGSSVNAPPEIMRGMDVGGPKIRTIKRLSVILNKGKWEEVSDMARAYANEKQKHLDFYQKGDNFSTASGWRERRNDLKQSDHHEQTPLPVHASDLAVKDAFETELKYWASIAAQVEIHDRKKWTEEQRHYANWLLFDEQRFSTLINGRGPINQKINLTLQQRKQVQNYLRREAREIIKDPPRVRIARSFCLDNSLYAVFKTTTAQGISISGLERGNRIRIPLLGDGEIKGNIRVVLHPEIRRIEIHIATELKVLKNDSDVVMGLDAGITEVFADDEGNFYGQGMGKILKKGSSRLNDKGKKRSKLDALSEKYLKQGKIEKYLNIQKYNLGKKTLGEKNRKEKITIEIEINRAIVESFKKRKPKVIVTEKLDIRGRAKSKEISRRVSYWHRRTLKERIEFKASAAGCRREQVNPAYTSQVCPACGYLNKANRKGDRFQCLMCGYAGHADVIAAINLKARRNDREITLYTPKETVRKILVKRYEARLGTPECLVREVQDGDRSGADSRT